MSINGMMRTSISGMAAQAVRLGTVAGNIANASTVGYKAATTQFSSLLLDTPSTTFVSGGVETQTQYGISRQGVLESSVSPFDLGITGSGFFLVNDAAGSVALTRAGAFVPDGEGNLVNSAGYTLLGLPAPAGAADAIVSNGIAGLVPVRIDSNNMTAVPTTAGALTVNLPALAPAVAAVNLPSGNTATSVSSARSSIVVYGNLGEELTIDLHYARTANVGEWEISAYDAAGRSPVGGLPYATGPLATSLLQFDGFGQLTPASAAPLAISVPGGATMMLDLIETTQLATDFVVLSVNTDGNPAGVFSGIEIARDGTIYETYANGTRRAAFRVPLASVTSPDRLSAKAGNIFEATSGSGDIRIAAPETGGLGGIISGALENSTVDLASELTDMIEAQRTYTANSRVFQTGAELMEVLVNLKR